MTAGPTTYEMSPELISLHLSIMLLVVDQLPSSEKSLTMQLERWLPMDPSFTPF